MHRRLTWLAIKTVQREFSSARTIFLTCMETKSLFGVSSRVAKRNRDRIVQGHGGLITGADRFERCSMSQGFDGILYQQAMQHARGGIFTLIKEYFDIVGWIMFHFELSWTNNRNMARCADGGKTLTSPAYLRTVCTPYSVHTPYG